MSLKRGRNRDLLGGEPLLTDGASRGWGPLSAAGTLINGRLLFAAGVSSGGGLLSTVDPLIVIGRSVLAVGAVHFQSIRQLKRISTCLFIILNRSDDILSLSFASLMKA